MICSNLIQKAKSWLVHFGIPKILIGGFVVYLFLEELHLYLFKKPTQNSISEMVMDPQIRPNIFICKNPAYHENRFRSMNQYKYKCLLVCQIK